MLEESNDTKANYYLALKNYFLQQPLTWGSQRTVLQLLLQEFDAIEQQKAIEGINAFIAKAQIGQMQPTSTTKPSETVKSEVVRPEQEIEEEQPEEVVQPPKPLPVQKIVRKEMPSQKPRIVIGDEEDDAEEFGDEEPLPNDEPLEVEEEKAEQLQPNKIDELVARGKIKK